MTLCVYALTTGAARVSARGLAGERLRLHLDGPVAAVAGQLPRPPAVSPELLRRYDGAMRRLAETLPAVLPVRFGTCFTDAAELALVLRSRRSSLRRAVAHVRNRVQMTVRVVQPPEAPAVPLQSSGARRRGPHPAAPGARRGPGGTGTAYLQERAAAVARSLDVAGVQPLRTAVSRWVRDERVERRGAIVSLYHLVPRASAAAYHRAMTRAAGAGDFRVVVTGPWPAYAFADALSAQLSPQ